MAYLIGRAENSGGTLAHYNLLEVIRNFAVANGWQELRYNTVAFNRELILCGSGYSGEQEIFIGLRTYHDVSADYYNLSIAAFTGYSASESFQAQPGAMVCGLPAHNINIDYFLTLTPQALTIALKLGNPAVYEHAHVGYMLPYGTPNEFPMPLVCIGMFGGSAAVRYSDTSHTFGYRGERTNGRLRNQAGDWLQPLMMPWAEPMIAGDGTSGSVGHAQPTGDLYWMEPVQLFDSNNVYGVLDGLYQITGWDNQTERVIQLGGSYTVDDTGKTLAEVVAEIVDDAGGRAFVTLQDVSRTGFNDHIALELR